ncbi:hypothetical protein RND81_10G015300 [Saponaria officinalis]|uniref:F-box domain-containing protein n=1 Tax=Saponaria officinalis TaxID=3572 RepID=A0AAW1HXC2_SAPOF
MTSVDGKNCGAIENLDRISELPEPIILHILSCLPLEDSARASILSKTWKSYCALHPILYYDHNLIALQSLVSGGELDINQIRDMFLDDVHYHLSRARQLDSPIRKLALNVAINDSKCFSRLDTCLEMLRHINVQELCVIVQTIGCLWDDTAFFDDDTMYAFPMSVLVSKGLCSVHIRGCKFAEETFVGGGVSFSSLRRLCLSHVLINDHVFENMVNYCPALEMLVLDYCTALMGSLELSRFPKLKTALIEFECGWVDYVGIVDTNLECFKCEININNVCHISPAACASIRELTLRCTINQPSVFADFAATFPLVEEAEIIVHGSETFKAVSNTLRKLKFSRYDSLPVPLKEVHIDCPRLTSLDIKGNGLVELYVDCPKLKVFRYCGYTVPDQLFFSPAADLVESSVEISVNDAYDTLWFINLREFLELVMASLTHVYLSFNLPMATFEPEQVEAFHTSPRPRHNVHLGLWVRNDVEQNAATIVDAVLWIIRPTTLIVGTTFDLLKYLCENLIKKSKGNICDEQVTTPCWLHQLVDFQVESSTGTLDIKENLVDLLKHRPKTEDICFKFLWS